MLDRRTLPDAPTGDSPCIRQLRREARTIAKLDANVLLRGETGTGKGRLARWLHALSPRAERPFVHVDCGALTPSLIESELFGHERGAFTGADGQHAGRFERAGEGTIFLDEIGELSGEIQAKLLRILEDREYERVGGSHTLRMRARVIAATSRPLEPGQHGSRFRADLFYRLSVFQLLLPPLRERPTDIPALANEAMARIHAQRGAPPRTSAGFFERLAEHDWPGNVRELLHAVERAALRADGGRLHARDVDEALRATVPASSTSHAGLWTDDRSLPEAVALFERERIVAALERNRGNVSRTAKSLGIPRGTLRHKLDKLSIAPAPQDAPPEGSRPRRLSSARESA